MAAVALYFPGFPVQVGAGDGKQAVLDALVPVDRRELGRNAPPVGAFNAVERTLDPELVHAPFVISIKIM